jgi:hypothetical protein
MKIDPRAGQLAKATDLVDVAKLIAAYYEERPDPDTAEQRVIFGTSPLALPKHGNKRGCDKESKRSSMRPFVPLDSM